MSREQLMVVEGHLDSYFIEVNSNETDPAKRVTFYEVSDVDRRRNQEGGFVYTARLSTNLNGHDLQITVEDESSAWGMNIWVDGEQTL